MIELLYIVNAAHTQDPRFSRVPASCPWIELDAGPSKDECMIAQSHTPLHPPPRCKKKQNRRVMSRLICWRRFFSFSGEPRTTEEICQSYTRLTAEQRAHTHNEVCAWC